MSKISILIVIVVFYILGFLSGWVVCDDWHIRKLLDRGYIELTKLGEWQWK